MSSSTRYDGKPLLRLLECYVLKAIHQLDESHEVALKAMESKLAEVYAKTGAWDQIIAAVMELPENMPTLIRQMWERNQEIARASGVSLSPQHFAEMFVDANLT
jgi:hypothetical protein